VSDSQKPRKRLLGLILTSIITVIAVVLGITLEEILSPVIPGLIELIAEALSIDPGIVRGFLFVFIIVLMMLAQLAVLALYELVGTSKDVAKRKSRSETERPYSFPMYWIRSRWIIVAAFAFFMIVLSTFLAFQVARAQERSARLSHIQTLAAYSDARLDRDPELSLLLAREALSDNLKLGESILPEVMTALHNAIYWSSARHTLQDCINGKLCEEINSVAFSPDGLYLATAGNDDVARVWYTNSGDLRFTLIGHTGNISSTTYSPDGRFIVTSGEDITARVWNITDNQIQLYKELTGHTASINSAAFSSDSRLLVTASADYTAIIWDVATRTALQILKGHTAPVNQAFFSRDGQLVITAGDDLTIRIWDVNSGHMVRQLTNPNATSIGLSLPRAHVIALSSDGRQVVGFQDGQATIWDVSTGDQIRSINLEGHTNAINQIAFSPDSPDADGRFLATASWDRSIRVWDRSTGQLVRVLNGHTAPVASVSFSPDGRYLASGSYDTTAKLWEWNLAGVEERLMMETGYSVCCVAFPRDGHLLFTASDDGTVRQWNPANGVIESSRSTTKSGRIPVRSLAITPDGQRLFTGSANGQLKVWDTQTWQEQLVPNAHTDVVSGLAISSDGSRLVSTSWDHTAKVWDVSTSALVSTWTDPDPKGRVLSAAINSDGSLVVVGGQPGKVILWYVNTQTTRILDGHRQPVCGVAISPNGDLVASSSKDGTVKLWDVASGELLATFDSHTGAVNSVSFDPSGRFLVSASSDKTAKVWDVKTKLEQYTLLGNTGDVRQAIFSPDGKTIVTAGEDNVVRQYIVDTDELLALVRTRTTRTLTPEERSVFVQP
jgi:WD40 repeat protein